MDGRIDDGSIALHVGYNRIEVIDLNGRAYTHRSEEPVRVELIQQDQGRTLKIFIGGKT